MSKDAQTDDTPNPLVEEMAGKLCRPGEHVAQWPLVGFDPYCDQCYRQAESLLLIVLREKAGAWDEGFKQGGPMHDEDYDDPDAHTRNPYRQEATDGR